MNSFFYVKGKAIALATLSALLTLPTYASNNKPEFIILGPASVPEYMGSEDYNLVPMIVSQFDAYGTHFEIEGLTARASLLKKSNWDSGITLNLDFGRDDTVKNAYVQQMANIDGALNVGVYVSHTNANAIFQDDEIELRTALFTDTSNTHSGMLGVATATYSFPLILPFKIDIEVEATYANSDYMNTYFGVNEEDALASGYSTYNASSGLRDISFNTNIGIFTSPKWGSFMRLGVTKFMSDAKDSPIVTAGESTQYFVGLGVFYRFN